MRIKLIGTDSRIATDGYTIDKTTYRCGNYTIIKDERLLGDGKTYHYKTYTVTKDRDVAYVPDIYYVPPILDEDIPVFVVQTTSYGSLLADEYARFAAKVAEALQVVRALNEMFLTEGGECI